ncbi:HAD family hydrolase [Actinomycetospora termitidis]|uniref:HAD family hydrolase n=1 Tax=Actinomycetospora termitidis TaxID=3053470 RepID=A0ABT7MA88_9PSEU|nr:HAD family hydrolase [Actinomycetospora sp. Odt1-22]MDL5156343.1 HAD family hydrolase [Actinomycetospora sp. Odt1-22]
MADTVILDVDGTLVDSNYQHALAWYRAFRRHDVTVPVWHLHRAIGMGGDQLVAHVSSQEVEDAHGDDLRAQHSEEFDALIDEVAAFADTQALLSGLREQGLRLVLATSGGSKHAEHFLDLIDGRSYADDVITSGDVEASKPAPDLIELALEREHTRDAVLVGDSVWDGQAGVRAGVPFIAVRTGGFSDDELVEAGAGYVAHDLSELLDHVRREVASPQ